MTSSAVREQYFIVKRISSKVIVQIENTLINSLFSLYGKTSIEFRSHLTTRLVFDKIISWETVRLFLFLINFLTIILHYVTA